MFFLDGLYGLYIYNFYFTEAVNKAKRGKTGCRYSRAGFSQAAGKLFFPDLLHIVFQVRSCLENAEVFHGLCYIRQICKTKIGFGDKFI